jgi:predicted nucleic acid-binding protein
VNAYADSSFLVSLIVADANSVAARRFMVKHQQALPFNPLHRQEVRNGIRLRVHRKEIDVSGRDLALQQIDDDLAEGLLVHQPMPWTEALRRAEALSAAHAEHLGTRSADTVHVAAALLAGVPCFLSFDKRQRALAKAAGLVAKP